MQETYEVEDCVRYNSLTTNDEIWSSSSAVVSYSSNGMHISNGNWNPFYLLDELSQDVSIEFDVVTIHNDANYGFLTVVTYDPNNLNVYGQTRIGSVGHYKFIVENDVLTLYKDSTAFETHSFSYSSFYWVIWTGGTRTVTLKNLKVKAL